MSGRPTLFSPEILKLICDRLSDGEPLEQICRDAGMPASRTIREWGQKDEAISAAIAHAREAGFDAIASNARRTARGDKGFSSGFVDRDKLMVETDLKLLAKWDPKRYGDRIVHASDPDAPLIPKEMRISVVTAAAVEAVLPAIDKPKGGEGGA